MAARLVWTATFLPDSRQSRQLGAKCDKLSRIPREWRRRKIFTPRMPVGRSSFLSLYPLVLLPRRSRLSRLYPSEAPSPRQGLFQYASAETRLSAGQGYLHKSAMQSLFIFCESMSRIYATQLRIHANGSAFKPLGRTLSPRVERVAVLQAEKHLKYTAIYASGLVVSGMGQLFCCHSSKITGSLGKCFLFTSSRVFFFLACLRFSFVASS